MKKLKKLSAITQLSLIGILLGSFLISQSAMAVEHTRALATDSRIKVVAFDRDNVVPVHASTFTTTQIVFGKGEVIENIQNGDLDAWTVSVQKGLPNMLFLKPTILGSNTNMTIVTNLHTYYFHLMSNTSQSGKSSRQNDSTYAIQFSYPAQVHAKMLANLRYNKLQHRAILNSHTNPQNYN